MTSTHGATHIYFLVGHKNANENGGLVPLWFNRFYRNTEDYHLEHEFHAISVNASQNDTRGFGLEYQAVKKTVTSSPDTNNGTCIEVRKKEDALYIRLSLYMINY